MRKLAILIMLVLSAIANASAWHWDGSYCRQVTPNSIESYIHVMETFGHPHQETSSMCGRLYLFDGSILIADSLENCRCVCAKRKFLTGIFKGAVNEDLSDTFGPASSIVYTCE